MMSPNILVLLVILIYIIYEGLDGVKWLKNIMPLKNEDKEITGKKKMKIGEMRGQIFWTCWRLEKKEVNFLKIREKSGEN